MQSVQQIVFDILADNETRKQSDSELKIRLMVALCWNANTVFRLASEKTVSIVAKYRSQYNRGLLRTVPIRCSFRYANGIAVNRNDSPLTFEDQCLICSKYNINDERFQCKTSEVPSSR